MNKRNLKLFLNLICGLLPFSVIRIFFLRILGNKISFRARVGWGIYFVDKISMESGSKTGVFNFFKINTLILGKDAFIKELNYFKGPFNVVIGDQSGIGRQNKFRRSNFPVSYSRAELTLGTHSFLTSNNFFDLTKSIFFGDNTQLGGIDSQFWTHGYMHADTGKERIRIDGEIIIKNNVYIGSRCLFNPGVTVSNAINIGGNSVISKDLEQPGMYVNQQLRYIKVNINDVKNKLKKVEEKALKEEIYTK